MGCSLPPFAFRSSEELLNGSSCSIAACSKSMWNCQVHLRVRALRILDYRIPNHTSGCKVETGALWFLQTKCVSCGFWNVTLPVTVAASAALPGFQQPLRHILSRCHGSVAASEHGVDVSVTRRRLCCRKRPVLCHTRASTCS